MGGAEVDTTGDEVAVIEVNVQGVGDAEIGEDCVVIPSGVNCVETDGSGFGLSGARDGKDGIRVGIAFDEVDGTEVVSRHDADLDGDIGHG